ncbi:MAG: hypothetical protein IJU61_00920, partial [Victivallales bacterium]|nr:hypothetical protein [Victivallales bacterium]
MKQTILALAFLAAGGYLEAKQIAVYGRDGKTADVLAKALKSSEHTVVTLDADEFCNKETLLKADLLVIADPKNVPAASAGAIHDFLAAKKSMLLLGPRPFWKPVYKVENEWLTREEHLERRAQTPCEPLKLPPRLLWSLSMREKDIKTKMTIEGPNGLHYQLDTLMGWTTFAAPCIGMFPKGHDLMCLSVKGNPNVRSMCIELVETDGSRWIATAPVSTEWRKQGLEAADFRFWHDCSPTKPRGGKGDVVNFSNVRTISIGLADTHTPGSAGADLEFWIKDMGTAVNPYKSADAPAVNFAYMETYYPAYKQFPIKDRPGCFSTMNRWQGRGFNQKASWRYRPLKMANGQLSVEEDPYAVSSIWMTHYLDGDFASSRVATIAEPVKTDDASYLATVKQLVERTLWPMELIGGGTHYFGMFPDQTDDIGYEMEVFEDLKDTKIAVEMEVKEKNGTVVQTEHFSPRATTGLKSAKKTFIQPKADTQYIVTTKLLVNGKEWDHITQEVYATKTREALHANKKGFITVKDSNFMLDGKPWYPVGVNYWTSNYAALEWRRYMQGFLVAGFYDTEQIEKDLSVMESVGINMLSVQLLGDTGKEDTLRNLIDFFHRCRAHNMYVNGFLKPASPFAFNDEKVEAAMKEGELAHFTELFAYDLCWEPGNYAFDAKSRPAYDIRWNKWLKERYGSVENAIKDWGIEPNRNEKGQVASPTDGQLRMDGDWRIYVAAYRRFMDDVTSQMWNVATRKMRALAPNQLMSFRQGNTLAHDFALTGPVKHMDFICPEGYAIPNNENGYNAAAFITRYVHFASGGKPIIWAEFGKSIWDAQAVDISDAALKGCTDYHDLFYRMVIDSGANGTAPWWWSGWYRVGERSDFGIANPDGTPRPMATMLKKYAPLMKAERVYDEGEVPFMVDRDAHAGGYWYMAFNTGRDAYKAAREQKKQLKLISEATGKTSADVPLKAIGNVPCNGFNPPKYLNAEFNSVMLVLPNGTRIGVLNGAEIELPKNSPVVVDVSIGNLGEATWVSSSGKA